MKAQVMINHVFQLESSLQLSNKQIGIPYSHYKIFFYQTLIISFENKLIFSKDKLSLLWYSITFI